MKKSFFIIYVIIVLTASYIQSEFFPRSQGFVAALIVTGAILSIYGYVLIADYLANRNRKSDIIEAEFRADIRKREDKIIEDTAAFEVWKNQQLKNLSEYEAETQNRLMEQERKQLKSLTEREKKQEISIAEREEAFRKKLSVQEASANKKLLDDADRLYLNIANREKALIEEMNQKLKCLAEIEENTNNKLKEQENQQLKKIDAREQELNNMERQKLLNLSSQEQELNDMERRKLLSLSKQEQHIRVMTKALNQLFAEKTSGFPWLATAYADYIKLQDEKKADWLENKTHPALTAAEMVREIKREKADLVRESKQLKYIIQYYESLFPWLIEFREINDEDIFEVVSENSNDGYDDAAQRYLTSSEYKNLTPTQKYQIALDRYMTSKKSKWQVGRDYERYVGYLYEQKSYRVQFHGIIEGFEDLGRDLICKNGMETHIVQCKCWAHHKIIHEKHINQLFGTAVMYAVQQMKNETRQKISHSSQIIRLFDEQNIKAILITSTAVSETARKFADALGVEVQENFKMPTYPLIKCNINSSTGEKIYHLPFDQQYDRVQCVNTGECYVNTVIEAENAGFRRAMRWMGNEN